MIDDRQDELAALHALGLLEGPERRSFESEMSRSPELSRRVSELTDTASELAWTAPPAAPPDLLKTRILEAVGERRKPAVPRSSPISFRLAIPWALAAGFAVLAVWSGGLWFVTRSDNAILDSERKLAELAAQRARNELEAQTILGRHMQADLQAQLAVAQHRVNDSVAKLAQFQKQNRLARLQIVTLRSVPGGPNPSLAVVVWDPSMQQGMLEVAKLPPLNADQDYQLWAIDRDHGSPVDSGVFRVDSVTCQACVTFRARFPIKAMPRFAVSLERRGGDPRPLGPIVLAGE